MSFPPCLIFHSSKYEQQNGTLIRLKISEKQSHMRVCLVRHLSSYTSSNQSFHRSCSAAYLTMFLFCPSLLDPGAEFSVAENSSGKWWTSETKSSSFQTDDFFFKKITKCEKVPKKQTFPYIQMNFESACVCVHTWLG